MATWAETHPSTQCAAVTIHWWVMMEPPQTWVPCTWRLTCHGHCPSVAPLPPTILLIVFTLLVDRPHSKGSVTHTQVLVKERAGLENGVSSSGFAGRGEHRPCPASALLPVNRLQLRPLPWTPKSQVSHSPDPLHDANVQMSIW